MSAQDPRGTALVPRHPGAPDALDDLAMQKLWLATQRRPWRSLAIIAGSKGLSTIEVANLFAKIAWWYRGTPTCVVDLRDTGLRLVEHQLREVASQMQDGQRVIVALRSIFENPTTIEVASVTDAAILCVHLGETKMAAAERTVAEIGRDKFIGSVILRDPRERPRT